MPLSFRYSTTATGKACIEVGSQCESEEFAARALEIVDHFRMVVEERIDGFDERLWIVRKDHNTFCISWDVWLSVVSIMAWESTPESAIIVLKDGA